MNPPSTVTIEALHALVDAMLHRPRAIIDPAHLEPMSADHERALVEALADLVEDVVGPTLDDLEERRAEYVRGLLARP